MEEINKEPTLQSENIPKKKLFWQSLKLPVAITTKTKLLIGVLVVIVLGVGGLWVWGQQLKKPAPPGEPGDAITDENYCGQDSDCVFLDFDQCCPSPNPCKTKPGRVINKEYKERVQQKIKAKCPSTCPPYAPPQCFECLNLEKFSPVCINHQCSVKREINCEAYCQAVAKDKTQPCPWISNKDLITKEDTEKCQCLTSQAVTIATDKTEYEQGEKVKITFKNGLSKSIWYNKHVGCGESFWWVEQLEDREWKRILVSSARCKWPIPQPEATELSASEEINVEWDLKVYDSQLDKRKFAQKGLYRVGTGYGFEKEGEGNFAHAKDGKTIYSNEFRIKEIVQPQEISCQSELAEKQAQYLGLSCEEFNILAASVYEYLYKKYPFTRETDFGIRYERVRTAIGGVPQGGVVVDAFANFRTPPVVIRAAFYDGNAWVISEESSLEE